MSIRRLIKTDGTERDLGPGPIAMSDILTLIDAKTVCTVNLHHLGEPLHVMIVDDDGYESELVENEPSHFELHPVKARKPVNEGATALYWANCRPGTSHCIVGDCVVIPDSDL